MAFSELNSRSFSPIRTGVFGERVSYGGGAGEGGCFSPPGLIPFSVNLGFSNLAQS